MGKVPFARTSAPLARTTRTVSWAEGDLRRRRAQRSWRCSLRRRILFTGRLSPPKKIPTGGNLSPPDGMLSKERNFSAYGVRTVGGVAL